MATFVSAFKDTAGKDLQFEKKITQTFALNSQPGLAASKASASANCFNAIK